jgi:hypothetical protein
MPFNHRGVFRTKRWNGTLGVVPATRDVVGCVMVGRRRDGRKVTTVSASRRVRRGFSGFANRRTFSGERRGPGGQS